MSKSDLAREVFLAVPKTLRNALKELPQFEDAVDALIEPSIEVSPDHRFERSSFFKALEAAIDNPETSQSIETRHGKLCSLTADDDGTIVCESDTIRIHLPETRVTSKDRNKRLAGLEALAKSQLPKDAYQSWLSRIDTAPLSNEALLELGKDVSKTPTARIAGLDRSLDQGSVALSQLVPASDLYWSRLLGSCKNAQDVNEGAQALRRSKLKFLSHLPKRQRWQRAFSICNHRLLTEALPISISSTREAIALIEWAQNVRSPVAMVSVIEYMLPLALKLRAIDEPLAALVKTFLELDPATGALEYQTFSNLLMAIDAEIARSPELGALPVFYRRLMSSAQASLILTFSEHDREDISAMAAGLQEQVAEYALLKAILDTKTTPRWNPELYDPKDIFADHMGRIYTCRLTKRQLLSLPHLRRVMHPDAKDGFFDQLKWPRAFQCGVLEGDHPPSNPLPRRWRDAISQQLAQKPFTVRSLVALVNAVPYAHISEPQFDKLMKSISELGFHLKGLKSADEASVIFIALSSLSVIRKDETLAKTLGILLRRHVLGLEHAIGVHMYFRTSLWLSRAFDSENDGLAWLADQIEHLAFADLNARDADILTSEIEMTCRMSSQHWIPLSRARKALSMIPR